MTTLEMFKFWFIKEIGLPVAIIALLVLCLVVWAFIYTAWEKIRKRVNRR